MSERVVVWDPKGAHPEGEVIVGTSTKLIAEDWVVMLPVEVELMARSGAAGWVKRCFGRGVEFDARDHRFGCSIVLHVFSGFQSLDWAARLAPSELAPGGYLKLAGESGKPGAGSGGLISTEPPFQLDRAREDVQGGRLIGGKARLAVPVAGFLALGLYGLMTGGKVEWLAVSQSR